MPGAEAAAAAAQTAFPMGQVGGAGGATLCFRYIKHKWTKVRPSLGAGWAGQLARVLHVCLRCGCWRVRLSSCTAVHEGVSCACWYLHTSYEPPQLARVRGCKPAPLLPAPRYAHRQPRRPGAAAASSAATRRCPTLRRCSSMRVGVSVAGVPLCAACFVGVLWKLAAAGGLTCGSVQQRLDHAGPCEQPPTCVC